MMTPEDRAVKEERDLLEHKLRIEHIELQINNEREYHEARMKLLKKDEPSWRDNLRVRDEPSFIKTLDQLKVMKKMHERFESEVDMWIRVGDDAAAR